MCKSILSVIILTTVLNASFIEKISTYNFHTTIKNLKQQLEKNDFTIQAIIDQTANAKKSKSL